MPVLFSVVLAAAVVPAAPVEPNTWFTSKDHPKTAMQVVERGFIAYQIDVAPDGAALRCAPQGKTDLDAKVCELVMKSARFRPATDAEGRPAFGVHEGVASFLMPGKPRTGPDRWKKTVTLDTLPDGVTAPAFARVAFTVDASGAISGCTTFTGEQQRRFPTVPALGPAACDALAKDYRPLTVRNAGGEAVPSIQSAMVRFETGAQ